MELAKPAVTFTADFGPIPNLPLLRKVLDHIDAYPEKWDQCNWGYKDCGTAMCVAGWACELSDAWDQHGDRRPSELGREVLGLTLREAHDLFVESIGDDAAETRCRVQAAAERIAARAGERL